MKLIFIELCVLVFFILSCNQLKEKIRNDDKLETNAKVENPTKYLSQKELFDFVKTTKTVELSKDFSTPFDTLDFNKVIAYDFDGKGVNASGIIYRQWYSSVVIRQKELQIKDIKFLINFLTNNKTYGEFTMACFEPHLGIVFYKNKDVRYVIDICLDCNFLKSSTEIPASTHTKIKFEDGIESGLEGFSKYGRRKIIALSKILELDYGKILK